MRSLPISLQLACEEEAKRRHRKKRVEALSTRDPDIPILPTIPEASDPAAKSPPEKKN
jgi:hypothetical protein